MNHKQYLEAKSKAGEDLEPCFICKKWTRKSAMRGGTLFDVRICFSCLKRLEKFMDDISEEGIEWFINRIGIDKIRIKIKIE